MSFKEKSDEMHKSIRGRFIIQEIPDKNGVDTPKKMEETCVELEKCFSLEGTKKRRGSFGDSKFKLNSKTSHEIQSSQFLVYDFKRQNFVDINDIFLKYEGMVMIKDYKEKDDWFISKNSLHLFPKREKNIDNKGTEQLPILKNLEMKRIESISTFAHDSANFETSKAKNVNWNVCDFTPKKNVRIKRYLSLNSRGVLLREHVHSLMIESQSFKECSLRECQFTL